MRIIFLKDCKAEDRIKDEVICMGDIRARALIKEGIVKEYTKTVTKEDLEAIEKAKKKAEKETADLEVKKAKQKELDDKKAAKELEEAKTKRTAAKKGK